MMFKKALLSAAALGFVLSLSLAASPPAPVGPPWVSLELPANPLDPQTRDAVLVVHAYHHQHSAGFPVVGIAEGLVDGERSSIALELTATSRPGVYALAQQWPARGDWVLALNVEGRSDATLYLELGPNGGVEEAEYYGMTTRSVSASSIRVVPGEVSRREIDKALTRMATE